MDMSTALAADLARLTEALDDPGVVDLPALLGRCHDALLAAVPSGLGLSMTFPAGPGGVTVSTLPAAGTAIRSSLRVPMTPWADVDPGSDVVFYAATAGALVDLAADLGWALHCPATVCSSIVTSRRRIGVGRVCGSCPSFIGRWGCCSTGDAPRTRPATNWIEPPGTRTRRGRSSPTG